jgi:TldD protein
VLVDGTWAFAYGTTPTTGAIAKAARDAVAIARGYARIATKRVELAPAPVATGEWSTPMQLDPFAVPLRDQFALLGAYLDASARVLDAATMGLQFQWRRETRVFASTDGALTTQILRKSDPEVTVAGGSGMGTVSLVPMGVSAGVGGYETVAVARFQEELERVALEAVRLSRLPRRPLEAGRYPVVFDGFTFGAAFGSTVGAALEADRVLGYEADAAGTSYLTPDLLGTPIGSPLLNVTGDRTAPYTSAVQWDDEGVVPRPFPLVTEGRLVDYCTSRQTAVAFREWYEKQGKPVQSNGCAVSPDVDNPMLIRAPHLVVAPSRTSVSLDDLCRSVQRGLLVRSASYFSADQQLSSASLTFGGTVLEIAQGKIVRRVHNTGFRFNSRQFWKSLTALGDTGTIQNSSFNRPKGQPWRYVLHGATAPAGLFKDLNVFSTAIHL